MAEPRLSPVEALAGQVLALARRLDGMEEDRRADGTLVRQMAARMGVPMVSAEDDQNRDQPVLCAKCGTLNGYYDPDTDVVRVRSGAHLVFMRMGPGGSIEIMCRKCSNPVVVTYAPPDGAATAEARDGLLVLDVATLTSMLDQAMQSGSGQVTLRLVESSKR